MKKRMLLKLSGEVLKGSGEQGISWETLDAFCERLHKTAKKGVELAVVAGGGNIFRGAAGSVKGYDRLAGDQIGMLATVINGLAIAERLRSRGVFVEVQSAIKIEGVVDTFDKTRVEDAFAKGGIVIFTGGTGNPYFSTDTTAALRALQIGAEYVLKSTKVDGIYDKDPAKHKDARKYDTITFDEIIEKKLGVMDLTSVLMMKENGLKLMVFDMMREGELEKACEGQKTGTLVEK